MLPFELIPTAGCRQAFQSTIRPLPVYVEPASEETLLSWLLRLATRLGVSLHVLARQSFGIDDRAGHTRWWCRPHPWVLKRISERTGVSVARLRPMTLDQFVSVYRDDEAPARFTGRRYDASAPERRAYRFAACAQCLKSDATPYLRTPWLIGWMAVCPQHATRLMERCRACHAGIRVAPFTTAASFSPATCTRCANSLLDDDPVSAHPSVIRMQTALLSGKSSGTIELEGLGRLSWMEMVALVDVLIGMVWTDLTLAERQNIFLSYISDLRNRSHGEDSPFDCRHGSLQFLTWLTEGWPNSAGAKMSQNLLARWLAADRNRLCRHLHLLDADPWTMGPTNFEPPIRERLRALVDAR